MIFTKLIPTSFVVMFIIHPLLSCPQASLGFEIQMGRILESGAKIMMRVIQRVSSSSCLSQSREREMDVHDTALLLRTIV